MDALILVDIQYDFLPGGALGIPSAAEIVPLVNRLIANFELVLATQDWHPADHASFAVQHSLSPGEVIDLDGLEQVLWPVHCVQGSRGAEFSDELNTDGIGKVFRKGTNQRIDSYSGFFDNGHRHDTGLADYLKSEGVTRVTLAGLATDYCVLFTAMDSISAGFETRVVVDACRGVDLNAGDVDLALAKMQTAGIELVQSADLAP